MSHYTSFHFPTLIADKHDQTFDLKNVSEKQAS